MSSPYSTPNKNVSQHNKEKWKKLKWIKKQWAVFVDRPTNRMGMAQGYFMVGPRQSRSLDTPGIPKNASGPIGIPPKRGASGVRWKT